MLRVRLLGGLALESDDGPLDAPASRPARELLAWLALHPGAHPRFELAQRLWPDVPESSARASLRTTLHELRRALGGAAGHLAVDRERVGLVDVWVDLRDAPLEDGEPLAGIDRDWAIAARDAHAERVAERLARLADEAGTPAERVRWARELVRRDGLSEDAARRLMRALVVAGDRAAAMAEYLRLEHRLQREFSVAPSRETRRLLAEIRADAPPPLGAPRHGGVAGGGQPPPCAASSLPPTAAPSAPGTAPSPPAPPPPRVFPPALVSRGPLAGRDKELRRLTAGDRGAVLLAGEPGIGKTRLLAEAARLAHEDGAMVRYGRCYEEPVAPYEPFAEALGAGAFGALVDAAAGERWRLFEAVGAQLADSTIVLDDLHWADAGTLRLLAQLLRRADAPRVLGAYRDTEISRAHPLAATLADLRRDGLVARVPLHGLDTPAVAALVAAREGPADLAGALHAETGGNPFYIEEVLRHLAGAPLVPGAQLPIPEGVKDVIGRRLSRLAPGTEQVLAVASVAGREFDLALLEAVLAHDPLDALEQARSAQMVREERPGRYAFAHALIRETLYEELSLTRRVRTHQALADALEHLPGRTLAELAHHRLQAAAAGGEDRAAEAALAAAGEAMAALAYEDAAAVCERALAVLDEPSGEGRHRPGATARDEEARRTGATAPGEEARRVGATADLGRARRHAELLLALGDARLRAGEPARTAFADAAAHARALADAELLARAAVGFSGLGVTIIAVDRESVALLDEALEALDDDHPVRSNVVGRLAIETYYASSPTQRKARGDEAVALARPAGGAALLDALDARHAALWSAQYLDERLDTAREMLALAARLHDGERELQARNWLVCDLMERGDMHAVRAEIAAHEALAARLRLPAYTWWAPMWRSTLAILEGRFDDAERLIDEFSGIDDPNARLYAEIQGYTLAWNRGDFLAIDTSALDRERGRPAEYAYRSGYSWVLAEVGRSDEAREHVEWVARDDFARLGDDMNRLAALAELTQAMRVLDDPTHARGVLERLEPYADRNIPNGRGAAGYGSATHHVAVLEALLGQDARPRFEEALRRNAALGSRPWAERSRAALA